MTTAGSAALRAVRDHFKVEYVKGGRPAISYDSEALPKVIAILDAALEATASPVVTDAMEKEFRRVYGPGLSKTDTCWVDNTRSALEAAFALSAALPITAPPAVTQLGGAPDDLQNTIRVTFADMTIEQMQKAAEKILAMRDPSLTAPPARGQVEVKALEDVAAERRRQIEVEGWTAEHDDEHGNGELSRAAAAYAHHSTRPKDRRQAMAEVGAWPSYWPWDVKWWKPTDPRCDLVKAGALILAEIERLDRASACSALTSPAEPVQIGGAR